MVIKNKLLFVFILPTILIGIVFSIAAIATEEEHKSFELSPEWNIISITRHMVDNSISDMSEECFNDGKYISQAWIHDGGMDYGPENYIFVKGNVNYDELSGYPGFIDEFIDEIVGQPLWLFLEGDEPCTLTCGVDGCETDTVISEVECAIPDGCDCNLAEVEWTVDGSCGQGECDFGMVPAYKSCGEECPRTISCIESIEHPCLGIMSSSFNAHDNGDISLILSTPENMLCKVAYNNAILEDNFDSKIACENIDNENYLTSELTKKHRCKIQSGNIESEGGGRLQWTKRKEVGCKDENGIFKGFLLYTINTIEDEGVVTSLDMNVREFEVVEESRSTGEAKIFEGLTPEEPPELRDLRMTIVKGPGATGREGGSNRNLIWTTDRNAACRISDSLFEYTSGTPDSIEHTREVHGVEGRTLYILCRDEYDNHKSLEFLIDRTRPATIDDFVVIAEDGGNDKYKMTLTWRARGDLDSKIRKYDVRFGAGDGFPPSIHVNNWYDHNKLEGETYGDIPDPIKDGIQIGDKVSYETETVFDPGITYTFAIRAEDSMGNMGSASENIKCLNELCIPRTEEFPE